MRFTVSCGTETVGLVDANLAAKVTGTKTLSLDYDPSLADANAWHTYSAAAGYDLLGAFKSSSSSTLCPVNSVKIWYNPGSGLQ